ncbi:MAG TPA: fimbrial protein [Stenotrophomonas sp.]
MHLSTHTALKISALTLALSSLFAPAANAASGSVTFKGEIVQSTCNVSTASIDQTVTIGTFPTTLFKEVGDVSASKSFNINMENCEAGTYTLRFDGTTPIGHPELLSVSQATGVGIEILDNSDNVFPINQELVDPALVTIASTGKATVNLKARYKSFEKAVGAGVADATSTFSIEYR